MPELFLTKSTAEVDATTEVPVAVDILRPRGIDTRRCIVSIGISEGIALDITIQADVQLLVCAVLTTAIAGIKGPIGHRFQIRITQTDVQRIGRRLDIHQLTDARHVMIALCIGADGFVPVVERVLEVEIHLWQVVVLLHGSLHLVVFVGHVVATERLREVTMDEDVTALFLFTVT